jgi:hypothetical protein
MQPDSTLSTRPKKSLGALPLLLSAASFFFILIGITSVLFLQPELRSQNFDTRKQASVDNGQVKITTAFQDATISNPQASINLLVNTQGVQTDGVQVVFNVISNTFNNLTVQVPSNSGLHAVHQEIQTTSDGYLVSLIAVPTNIGQTFSSTSPAAFATLSFTPNKAGTITLSFDQENSVSTIHGTTPPQDGLATLQQVSFTTAGVPNSSPSPSPSVSPSPSPSVSPSVSPSIRPSTTPSPSPSASPSTGKQCNASCGSNAECAVNFRCYSGNCRLATNPSSSSCDNPTDQGIHRSCNEYCADTKECGNGYTCFFNRCRSVDNPDSTSCAAVSGVMSQAMRQSCNTSCSSNKDCAVNLRCYNGACRLATNPSSLSCSPSNKPLVSSLYSQKGYGQKGEEMPYPSVTPSPITRVSPSPLVIYPNGQKNNSSGTSDSASGSLLGQLNTWFAERGISLPLVAVVGGIVLLVLALLAFAASKMNRDPQKVSMGVQKPPSPYEQNLQQKIESLRHAQAKKEEPNNTWVSSGNSSAQSSLQTKLQTPTTTPSTETPHKSSMMERLKQKGVLDKMPNPTKSEE